MRGGELGTASAINNALILAPKVRREKAGQPGSAIGSQASAALELESKLLPGDKASQQTENLETLLEGMLKK